MEMKEKKDVAALFVRKPRRTPKRKSVPSDEDTYVTRKKTYANPNRYCRVPLLVMIDRSISLAAKCVYGLLSVSVFQGNVAKVSIRTLASQLGVSKGSISRALSELITAEHIKRDSCKRGLKANYELTSTVFGQKQGVVDEVYFGPTSRRLVSVAKTRRPA